MDTAGNGHPEEAPAPVLANKFKVGLYQKTQLPVQMNFVESFDYLENLDQELRNERMRLSHQTSKDDNYKELLKTLGEERKEKIEAEKIRRINDNKKKKAK